MPFVLCVFFRPVQIRSSAPSLRFPPALSPRALTRAQANAVFRALEIQALPGAVPAQLVRPQAGVTWLLDSEAAKGLRPQLWNTPTAFPRSEIPK